MRPRKDAADPSRDGPMQTILPLFCATMCGQAAWVKKIDRGG